MQSFVAVLSAHFGEHLRRGEVSALGAKSPGFTVPLGLALHARLSGSVAISVESGSLTPHRFARASSSLTSALAARCRLLRGWSAVAEPVSWHTITHHTECREGGRLCPRS